MIVSFSNIALSWYHLTYTYDATGKKLRNTGSDGSWDYIDGIVYHNDTLSFVGTEEGRAKRDASNTYTYEYNLKDHLGNDRLSLYSNSGTPTVLQEDEYYSFGLRKNVFGLANNNRYLYNGKEVQTDLANQYDYGARFYDPVIGRWTSVDPLAEMFDHLTPYNYGSNNPIIMVDPNGMAADSAKKEAPKQLKEVTIVGFTNAPKRQPVEGFWGYLNDFVTGGIHNGYRYNWNGQPIGLAPITGTPPNIGPYVSPASIIKSVKSIIKITSLVKKDLRLLKLARETFEGNAILQKEANALLEQIGKGNMNPGIGTKPIDGAPGVFEARSRGGARVYFRNTGEGVEVVGYSNKATQQEVINRIIQIFY